MTASEIALAVVASIFAATYWATDRPAPAILPPAPAASSSSGGIITSFGVRRTHNGRYTAQVVSAGAVDVGTAQSWMIHLEDTNRGIAHASVTARAWMPLTAVTSLARPTVHYVGGGNYRLDGLVLPRAGWWNVALVIDARDGADSVAFNVVLPAGRLTRAVDHRQTRR